LVLASSALSWACGGGVPTGSPTSGRVEGLVVEIVDRDIDLFETLRVRDADGLVWTFTTEVSPGEDNVGGAYAGFMPSHIRQHQLFGEKVVVVYRTEKSAEGDRLVALDVTDPPD